jgi:hypothetical protein
MSSWKASDSEDKFSSTVEDPRQEQEKSKDVDVEETKPSQLEKVQSSSKKSEIDPFNEPPDGGLNAWLKVLGCFLIYSNIW